MPLFWGVYFLFILNFYYYYFSRCFLCYNLPQWPSLTMGACQPCSAAHYASPPSGNLTPPPRASSDTAPPGAQCSRGGESREIGGGAHWCFTSFLSVVQDGRVIGGDHPQRGGCIGGRGERTVRGRSEEEREGKKLLYTAVGVCWYCCRLCLQRTAAPGVGGGCGKLPLLCAASVVCGCCWILL